MAKMMKKNSKIIRVSLRSGKAEKRAYIRTLRPLILEMVLSGLSTLNTLSPDALNCESLGSSPTSFVSPAASSPTFYSNVI